MANISSNTECNIELSEEETTALTKAKVILADIAKELWQSNNDDLEDMSFFFHEMSEGIENVLKGRYFMP